MPWQLSSRAALSQGGDSAAAVRAQWPALRLSAHVNTTRRYIVLILRGHSGHIAFAPKLPEVVGHGRGRNAAYRDLKKRLEEHALRLIEKNVPVPTDDIVAVKYVKVDLRALESRTNLQ